MASTASSLALRTLRIRRRPTLHLSEAGPAPSGANKSEAFTHQMLPTRDDVKVRARCVARAAASRYRWEARVGGIDMPGSESYRCFTMKGQVERGAKTHPSDVDWALAQGRGAEAVDEELARLARALAHPARVRIIRLLGARNACVCGELVEALPLAQSTVSQHLKVLKEAGLIQGEIDGPRVCYCLAPGALRRLRMLVAAL